jgi:hypothetical protein
MNKKLNLVNLPEWGQAVWVKTNPQSKLDAQAEELHWVGFNENTKDGHWIYWPKKSIVTVECNIKFNFDAKTVDVLLKGEHKPVAAHNMLPIMPTAPAQPSTQLPATPASSEPAKPAPAEEETPAEEPVPQWECNLTGRLQKILPDKAKLAMTKVQGEQTIDIPVFALTAMKGDMPTFCEVMCGPDKQVWSSLMKEEIDKLIKLGTLNKLVELPPGKSAVGCTWVLRKKCDAANKVIKHKSCLCTQGFLQMLGVNYHETTTPTINKLSLCYILSLTAKHDLEIHQINFKNAFLNGSLNEEIYMHQPPSFKVPGKEGHVWWLKKALYGLKQAGLQWYKVTKALFKELGLVASDYDLCMFYSGDSENIAIVAIHIDDCILCTSTLALAITLKDHIAQHFKILDLGEACWILGFEIVHD